MLFGYRLRLPPPYPAMPTPLAPAAASSAAAGGKGSSIPAAASGLANTQGLTLVHFSAQRKHFLWFRGCV